MMFMVGEEEPDVTAGQLIASISTSCSTRPNLKFMSDLLEIGSQCSHLSCNELDFLPIVCRCNKYYCRHHIAPDIHKCPIDPAANNSGIPFEKLQRCAVEGCRKPSLNAFNVNPNNPGPLSATCSPCQKSFCAE